ncbi:MAG: peptide chain release factor N(5)-glutamine methyltransferase [Clostridia bacterium]|nr:peptide chain release factor N(5)-glutamine methyltransferase [Clostridia bacterium]
MTAGEWLALARARLDAAGDQDAVCDAEWMLCEATGWSRSSLRLRKSDALSGQVLEKIGAWLNRRASGEPLQYALGTADFMGLRFLADARALIPRPETETLCALALERLKGRPRPRVFDLCCGTGAIGLSVAHFRPDASVLLTDISADALALAGENARRLDVRNVRFAQGDLFGAAQGGPFDLIACNPPYLDQRDMEELQPEVRREPALALFGGADGLDFYRRIAKDAPRFLVPGGILLLEVGQGQAQAVRDMLAGFARRAVHRDLSGVERVIEAVSPTDPLNR